MPAVARITPIWKKQKLFVAIFLLSIGGWFFWDGKVGYPRSNERWVAYDGFKGDHRLAEWPAYAQGHGWKAEPPHKYFDRDDILMQFALAGLTALAGAGALLYWLLQKERTVRTDAESVLIPSGRRVPFAAITGLGKKKWEAKGLATVRYELDGRKGSFVLDDYKYDRDPTHEILQEIEAQLVARTKV